jgi:trehalose synthase
MAPPEFVQISAWPLDRYRSILGAQRFAEIEKAAERARLAFAGRSIWHVSSTSRGGGVAELLGSLLPYVRGAGIDTRWAVIRAGTDFFQITKRLHNRLHGHQGDHGPLGDDERRIYESTLALSGESLARMMRAGDVAYLHDPQTGGLVRILKERGVSVIWRCHIGVDEPNQLVREAWDFLRPYVVAADACVFSRRDFVWEGLNVARVWLMPPAIDPFSPKNQALDPAAVDAIVGCIGLGPQPDTDVAPVFTRADGAPGRIDRAAEILQQELLPLNAPVVAQVSRWDRLKDPEGLMTCFRRHIPDPRAHLVMSAPATGAVSDDPEGVEVFRSLAESWRRMPERERRRIHLLNLPMDDLEENGAMVNALQRRADVLVQKSLAEGFGLTVTEAMWKAKPVIGSRVGGISDQIVDGESGVLIDDPRDLEAFGEAIASLLNDPERASGLGRAARQRVIDRYLAIDRLAEYVDLVTNLVGTTKGTAPAEG